jgi:hypothetical protein
VSDCRRAGLVQQDRQRRPHHRWRRIMRIASNRVATLVICTALAGVTVPSAFASFAYYTCHIGALGYDCLATCPDPWRPNGNYDCSSVAFNSWAQCYLTEFGCVE